MRIAQIAPFYEAVSLDSDGPEGRMISHLTSGLLRLGHDVTVFASGDSNTPGELAVVAPLAMCSYPAPKRHLAEALAMLALDKALAEAPAFDVIHVHAGLVAFPLMRRSSIPVVATVYGSLDVPEVLKVYREFCELALVATSSGQIQQGPDLNWLAVIPPVDLLQGEDMDNHRDRMARAYETVYEWNQLAVPSESPLRGLALCDQR